MEEIGLLITKTYGIAGLIMLSPFAGLIFLWRHYVKVLKEKDLEIKQLGEARTMDAQKVFEKLMDMNKIQSESNKETNMALERVGDLLSIMTSPPPARPPLPPGDK